MTLIKSISGIRGTIGGHAGEGLNPLDIVKFTSAYATLIRKTTTKTSNKIVVGRDARISGEMVKNVVCGTLMGMGFDVVNIGLASTPTTELLIFPLLAKIIISCKCRKYRGRKCDVLISYTSKGEKTSPLLWYYGSGGDEKFVFQVVLFINIAKVEKE